MELVCNGQKLNVPKIKFLHGGLKRWNMKNLLENIILTNFISLS